jgi:hypothetical protein
MALKFIENIRINMQLLHDFFKRLKTSTDENNDGIEDFD